MSSLEIGFAKSYFGGKTEAEVVSNIAKTYNCRRIYKYANSFGDKITHTDYLYIDTPSSEQEAELLDSPYVYNPVLVYDEGEYLDTNNISAENVNRIPSLGVGFDIDKVGGGYYGLTCWKILWQLIKPEEIIGVSLYEGDTNDTLYNQERVFCIGFKSMDILVIDRIKEALLRSGDYKKYCSSPKFIEGSDFETEPLVNAGKIDANGNFVGESEAARSALNYLKRNVNVPGYKKDEIQVPEKHKVTLESKRKWWKFW